MLSHAVHDAPYAEWSGGWQAEGLKLKDMVKAESQRASCNILEMRELVTQLMHCCYCKHQQHRLEKGAEGRKRAWPKGGGGEGGGGGGGEGARGTHCVDADE